MSGSKMLLAVTLAMTATVAAAIANPAQATSDKATRQSIPHWLNETIYRPDCPSADRDHASHSDEICDDVNCRWR